MAEVRAGQLPAPGAVDFQAVPLCLQKNDKGGENGTQLASTTFNSTSSATVHTYQFTINLSSLGSSNYIYIRYQADTYWSWFQYKSRYWYCDYLYMEMSYVVNESDFYNPEFYWHYQDPFD